MPTGNAALIAAGTGLGEALLHNVNGRFLPSPTEGGHADFAARTPRELAFVEELDAHPRPRRQRARDLRPGPRQPLPLHARHVQDLRDGLPRRSVPDVDPADLPAAISDERRSTGRCEQCVEALDMFVEAYGAEAGNLALRSVATAGVYIGGGIAPKILPALEAGKFIEAFLDKDPMVDLLRTLPVR